MNQFDQLTIQIIKAQETIIGPLAWVEAKKVPGLVVVDQKAGTVELKGNQSELINQLVAQYERLFGRASREVCKDAVRNLVVDMAPKDIPISLR